MFGALLQRLPAGEEDVRDQFTAISTETGVAVGLLGAMGEPNPEGAQEIGYGFNREVWGRGLATEAVATFASHLLTWESINAVTASTATTNPASSRVVEKAGFVRIGTGWSEDDGDLVSWQFNPSIERS
jgi:ribosomal-protein-alanine N-acetyltransferase